jgi:Uncharacterized conserved domain (SAYSvFN)
MPPFGFQRSRTLWEDCLRTNSENEADWTSNNIVCLMQQQRHIVGQYVRAILYEIQPIRYSVFVSSFRSWYRYCVQASLSIIVRCKKWIPDVIKYSIYSIRSLTLDQWKWIIAIALYYSFVRWIHAALDAGPVVIVLTVLAIIFTVGLSDEKDPNGLSAYSVFNKGFQKMLGSLDADTLLQQHVGGAVGVMQMMQHHHLPMEEVDDSDDEPPRRRRERVRPRNNDNNNGPYDNHHEPPAANLPNNNDHRPARKTGKKARRDRAAIERRREIRAQHEAALAMGFDHNNDHDALARLLENQEDDDAAVN